MKILFIGVNPKDVRQLNLKNEINAIEDIIENQPIQNRYKLKVRNGVTKSKMIQLIGRYKPDILHISGHGNEDSTMVFEDGEGYSDTIFTRQLGDLLNNYSSFIKCVLLSACYSLNDIENFSENIYCTIGMKTSISNVKAIEFSKSFYQELVLNNDFQEAYRLGVDSINLSEENDSDILKILIKEEASPPKIPSKSINWWIVLGIILIILIFGYLLTQYLNSSWQ